MDLRPMLPQLYGATDDPDSLLTRLVNDTAETLANAHVSVSWGDRLLTLDKSAGFNEEAAFRMAFAAIRGSHVYDQYNGPDAIAWRLNTLIWAGRRACQIGGELVECGTFKGDMAWVMLHTIGAERISRFWLFDSFEGFSPDYSSAEDFPESPGFLDFANGFYRQPGLYEYLGARFAAFGNVTLVKGFLLETLSDFSISTSTLRARKLPYSNDCSTVYWRAASSSWTTTAGRCFHRQREAEDDFMRRRGYEILELPTGQGLVVKR